MQFTREDNRIYAADPKGKLLAEILFPSSAERTVSITRTYVNDSLRGQGIAGELMESLIAVLIDTNQKAVPVCSYAVHWFEKNPQHQNLLATI